LSLIARVPVAGPRAVGLKVTEMVQLAPAATLVPQVLVWLNGAGTWMLAMLRAVDWPFINVIVVGALALPIAWSGNAYCMGVTVTGLALLTPVPLNATVRGDPVPLSVMVNEPVTAPATVGVYTTAMVQLAPAARLAPQVFVSLNGAPVWMLVMLSAVVWPFVSVTVAGALALPMAWDGNASCAGE
jgi:hypothetical protein